MRCGPLPLPLLLLLAAQLLLARTCGCASGREYPSRPGLDLRHAHLLLSQKARFFQHSGGAVVYSSGADELPGWDEEALEGPHARSRVGLAETFRRPGTGDFEFVLVWPELSLGGRVAHNRWRQSSNPVTTHHVSGYVPLDVLAPATLESGDRRAEPFGGLAKGSYVCLLRTPGHDSSSFCVGANNAYSQNQRRDAPGWWPGFQVSHKERQERVTWTELWVVNAKGQAPAPQPPPLPPQPPPLAEEGDMPVFDGFDVVLVIGQSNAVGYGPADSPEWRANEDTSGLPVYVLHAATQARQHLFNGPMLSRAQQNVNDFSVTFAKHYVLRGLLKPRRAVLIVHSPHAATALSSWPKTGNPPGIAWTTFPPQARVVQSWIPSQACNPALSSSVAVATDFMEAGLNMSLLTHALYRTDIALTLDPATRMNHSADLRSRFPGNRLVAVLWHQGEEDLGHTTIERWGACLSELIAIVRERYQQGPQAGELIPFLGGDLCPFLGGGHEMASFYKKNFAQGRYPVGWQPAWSVEELPVVNLSTGTAMLGFADSFQEFNGDVSPTPCDGAHFTATGLQMMGRRYADAYAALVRDADAQ